MAPNRAELTLAVDKNGIRFVCPFPASVLSTAVLGIVVALGLVMLLLARTADAETRGLPAVNAPGVAIRYDKGLQSVAEAVARDFPRLKQETETKLGQSLDAVPTIILLGDSREFLMHTDNDLATAFAMPGRELIVMDYSKIGRSPADFGPTLKHEISHLILNAAGASTPPKWFDEGVAQWAGEGMADILNPGSVDLLKRAVISDRLLGLPSLAHGFPHDRDGILLAYQESKSFVEFLAGEYGDDRLRELIAAVRRGGDFDRAIGDIFSADIYTLQHNWRIGLRRSYSWTGYLADRFIWLLFAVAAVITVAGFVKLKKRIREYRDEDEEGPPQQ